MDHGSEDLYRAVRNLLKAAEVEFAGNSYYLVSNDITGLIELIGLGKENAPAANDLVMEFSAALHDVRRLAETGLSGNRFYLVSHKLEELSFLSSALRLPVGKVTAAKEKTEPVQASLADVASSVPDVGTMAKPRTFDDLAAASKSRVDAVAASLAIEPRQSTAPTPAAAPETLADGELERRSSEPCSMAELAPPIMEPVASSSFPPHGAPHHESVSAAGDMGSSAIEIERSLQDGANPANSSAKASSEPSLQAAAPAHDSAAAATEQKVEPEKAAEAKPKEEKTLFALWLDMMFGRKT